VTGTGGAAGAAGTLTVTYDGRVCRYAFARALPAVDSDGDGVLWLSRDGHTWALTAQRAVSGRAAGGTAAGGDGVVRAPMPGTVVSVLAEAGQQVTAGQRLVIVEAMKMEHTVTAPADGTVRELAVKPGQQVRMDETLAVISPPTPVISPPAPVVSPQNPIISPPAPAVSPQNPIISPPNPAVSPQNPIISPPTPVVSRPNQDGG
jgi:hypothetical protein